MITYTIIIFLAGLLIKIGFIIHEVQSKKRWGDPVGNVAQFAMVSFLALIVIFLISSHFESRYILRKELQSAEVKETYDMIIIKTDSETYYINKKDIRRHNWQATDGDYSERPSHTDILNSFYKAYRFKSKIKE